MLSLSCWGKVRAVGKVSAWSHYRAETLLPYEPLEDSSPTYGEMQQPALKLHDISAGGDGLQSPTRMGGVFSRTVAGNMLLTQRNCEKAK